MPGAFNLNKPSSRNTKNCPAAQARAGRATHPAWQAQRQPGRGLRSTAFQARPARQRPSSQGPKCLQFFQKTTTTCCWPVASCSAQALGVLAVLSRLNAPTPLAFHSSWHRLDIAPRRVAKAQAPRMHFHRQPAHARADCGHHGKNVFARHRLSTAGRLRTAVSSGQPGRVTRLAAASVLQASHPTPSKSQIKRHLGRQAKAAHLLAWRSPW